MIETLRAYWDGGLVTLPTKPDKSPDVKGTWKGGVNDESCYKHGIGIICGKISGGLECLDFDNHFGDAKKTLSEFLIGDVKSIYEKYKLPVESTLSGGYHLVYRCDHIEGNQKLAQKPKKDKHGNLIPDVIIETRGEGGYFVAAPTPGYKLLRNNFTQVAKITKEERQILIDTAKSFHIWHEVNKVKNEQGNKPGDIFNAKSEAIDEMKASLIGAGWTEVRDREWRRPGKKIGISATLGKVAPNVLYVFSSNAYPFKENSAYTPFQVISLLDHKGDFSTFAKSLSERYSEEISSQQSIYPKRTKERSDSEYEGILKRAHIDLEVPVTKPPIVIYMKDNEPGGPIRRRLFTLGNFSAITGKSKSKKTFLSSLLLASVSINGEVQGKLVSDFPANKRFVILFDTEQSDYDAYMTAKRISDITNIDCPNFGAFGLREYDPRERCNIIDYAIKKYQDSIGYILIDGIADLATAINDEVEASRVVSLLMKWTKVYNCHITTIIHQNKENDYATGHLGSAIMKKAECIISVKKNQNLSLRSEVSCDMIRGSSDFNDFEFEIIDNLPQIISMEQVSASSNSWK
jgi:hypothetical protein